MYKHIIFDFLLQEKYAQKYKKANLLIFLIEFSVIMDTTRKLKTKYLLQLYHIKFYIEKKMNYFFEDFNTQNFPQIVDIVKPLWSSSNWDDCFRKIYAESILQNSFFENKLTFQLKEKGDSNKIASVMFFQNKKDTNNFDKWILENSINLNQVQSQILFQGVEYLKFMDSKVHSLMNDDDIKLSLFVSCKKGAGGILFEKLWTFLQNQGYKNMFLWTDCECNWQWYLKKGFVLVEESVYEKFSDEKGDFKTFIFKKSLDK